VSPKKTRNRVTPRAARAAVPTSQLAVDYLRDQGKPNLADAVKVLVAYATDLTGEAGQQDDMTLTFQVDERFRDHVTEKADAETVAITSVILNGFIDFLDGAWEPPKPERRPRGVPVEKVSMSIRAPQAFVDQVDRVAAEFTEARGWDTGRGYALNARQIAVAALARRFDVQPEIPPRGWDARLKILLDVPEEFRDFVRDAEKAGGPAASLVLRDGFAAFLDGSWTPPKPPRAPRGQRVTKIRMVAQVNEEIRDQVDKRGKDPELAGERGYRLNAQQVAIAALLDAYRVPERLLSPWAE
jgi:hypothetical protein